MPYPNPYGRERGETGPYIEPQTIDKMIDLIQRGAWDYIAARACGIGKETFRQWMQKGKDPNSPYALIRRKVEEARSINRAGAEMEVRKAQPLQYLRFGPGRDKPDEPGWGETKSLDVESNAQKEFEDAVLEAIAEVDPTIKERILEVLKSQRGIRSGQADGLVDNENPNIGEQDQA